MKTQCLVRLENSAISPLEPETHPVYHILVVDDEPQIRKLIANILTRFGYTVATADDGGAGWQALGAHHFDLVVTDNQMPNVTGIELLRKLRAAGRNLPVIMATGIIPKDELEREPSLKPAAILVKPFSKAELLRSVVDALEAAYGAKGRTARPKVR